MSTSHVLFLVCNDFRTLLVCRCDNNITIIPEGFYSLKFLFSEVFLSGCSRFLFCNHVVFMKTRIKDEMILLDWRMISAGTIYVQRHSWEECPPLGSHNLTQERISWVSLFSLKGQDCGKYFQCLVPLEWAGTNSFRQDSLFWYSNLVTW